MPFTFRTIQGQDVPFNNEESKGTVCFTLLVVLGLVFVIQFIVFILFACKGRSIVFGPRPVTEEPDSPCPYQFPFLPSYDMAVNEMHSPQSVNSMQENP